MGTYIRLSLLESENLLDLVLVVNIKDCLERRKLEESGYSDEVCEKVISELKPENLPKQYFFRTEDAVRTLSFDKIRRQVVG